MSPTFGGPVGGDFAGNSPSILRYQKWRYIFAYVSCMDTGYVREFSRPKNSLKKREQRPRTSAPSQEEPIGDSMFVRDCPFIDLTTAQMFVESNLSPRTPPARSTSPSSPPSIFRLFVEHKMKDHMMSQPLIFGR